MLSLLARHSFRNLKPVAAFMQKRSYIFRIRTSEKAYKQKDKIDETFSIIYKAPMEYYLAACNYMTTASVLVFGAFTAIRMMSDKELSTDRKELEELNGMATMTDYEGLYFAIGLVGFCISIRMILYKYPLRIYKNQSKYIAVFEGHLPLTKTKVNFESGNVKELPATGLLPWKEHRFAINNRSTIMYFEYFKTPQELFSMMQAPKKKK